MTTLLKFSNGTLEATDANIRKVLSASDDSDLPGAVRALRAAGVDVTKAVCDLLNARIPKGSTFAKCFEGYRATDRVGAQILTEWIEDDRFAAAYNHRPDHLTKRSPHVVHDRGDGSTPRAHADAGDDGEADFNKMVRAEMNASKCGEPQATAKVMNTRAGSAAYRKATDAKMVKLAKAQG